MGSTTTTYCDVCQVHGDVEQKNIQVIFTTSQTDGYGTEPYLTTCKLDICLGCFYNILQGNYLWGTGAQGDNTYSFKD